MYIYVLRFIAVWFTKASDLWSKSEELWEGLFDLRIFLEQHINEIIIQASLKSLLHL